MLEKVKYAEHWKGVDVEAYTDGYAYDQESRLYLMSVAGYEAKVKAITAALVTGREIRIIGRKNTSVRQDFSHRYRILGTTLGNNLLHQIVLADVFFKASYNGDKLLYVDRDEDAPALVYNSVRGDYSVPLIPEWSEWLYGKIRREKCLDELLGSRRVIRLSVREEELDAFISEGIRNGEIEF
ncbi:MAG: hypothetical protein L0196_07035 [candidate division Zixibacteria bacterium]|nr:hypothetical protein [candidate division Zixibacteria bacterium]